MDGRNVRTCRTSDWREGDTASDRLSGTEWRREGPPAVARPGQAAGDVAVGPGRAGEVSRGWAGMARADQCGVADGGRALAIRCVSSSFSLFYWLSHKTLQQAQYPSEAF